MDIKRIIGLMSGTSLDGIDLVCCDFSKQEGDYSYKILYTKFIPYSAGWKQKLSRAMQLSGLDLQLLDIELAEYFAEEINLFIAENNIENIDLIASHGHTVFHQPEKKLSLQIAAGQIIAANCQTDTLCDFRKADVALGGQGAPLVPIGDQLLFTEYNYCLNIGGIANISYEKEGKRTAYDICAANMVLNYYAHWKNLAYDAGGALAASGNLNEDLLKKLNALGYYQQPAPKSLGKEWVDENVLPLINAYNISLEDKMRTYVEHIALQIAANCNRPNTKILITGGGAYHHFLTERIQAHTTARIIIPEKNLIDFKEALAFAFLGYLFLIKENNILASVTGAKQDHCAGVLYKA